MAVQKAITREWIARAFTFVEDVVYIGLGLLLAASAISLLVSGMVDFLNMARGGKLSDVIVLLDRILLVLLIVELLYTVQVSFREHSIVPEPFLLVGMIAAIRRVLVVTAEFGHTPRPSQPEFVQFVEELAVLAILILVLVISLLLLRKRSGVIAAARA